MFVAANVCINLKIAEYVSPIIALIVGLHFIPLAFFMRIPSHLVIGGLMCLLATQRFARDAATSKLIVQG